MKRVLLVDPLVQLQPRLLKYTKKTFKNLIVTSDETFRSAYFIENSGFTNPSKKVINSS